MNLPQKFLSPLSWLYAVMIWLRNVAYDFKFIPTRRFNIPIISVGNLTVGGTGKTPFIEYLVRRYLEMGIKVCVISRGYKRKTEGTQLVSDGKKVYGTALTNGDEPYQIAKKFPSIIVVVDEKRVRAVEFVLARYNPGIILLDDGFQHRSLARNFDIVMIDGRKNLAKIPLLPAGRRREPLSSLQRANLLAFNHVSASSHDIMGSLKQYTPVPVIGIKYQANHLRSCADGSVVSINDLQGVPCVVFCGVGNPQQFKATVAEVGAQIVEFLVYPDHHIYGMNELSAIKRYFETRKARFIVTTEKDALRLQSVRKPDAFPIQFCYYLEIEIALVAGESILKYELKEKVDKLIE